MNYTVISVLPGFYLDQGNNFRQGLQVKFTAEGLDGEFELNVPYLSQDEIDERIQERISYLLSIKNLGSET